MAKIDFGRFSLFLSRTHHCWLSALNDSEGDAKTNSFLNNSDHRSLFCTNNERSFVHSHARLAGVQLHELGWVVGRILVEFSREAFRRLRFESFEK